MATVLPILLIFLQSKPETGPHLCPPSQLLPLFLVLQRWRLNACTHIRCIVSHYSKGTTIVPNTKGRLTIWREGACMHLHCAELVYTCNAKIFINSWVFFYQMQECNTEKHNDIGSESILAFCCIAVSANVSVMQCNTGPCVVLWTGLKSWQFASYNHPLVVCAEQFIILSPAFPTQSFSPSPITTLYRNKKVS